MNTIQKLIGQYAQTQEKILMEQIIGEIQRADKLWVAYSPVTKNHYLELHNGIPTAFLFSEMSFCEAFRDYLAGKKINISPLECGVNERVPMFSDFFRNGIEQVIVDNGQTFIILKMMDIIKKPDFSAIPPEERPILNPSLIKSANLFFQCSAMDQHNPDTENNFMKDLYEAEYLLPIVFDEQAPKGLSIRTITVSGASVSLAVIRRPDGRSIVPVFTDWVELGKFDKAKECTGNVVNFGDIEKFCLHGEQVVINPLGFNMIMDKTTVEAIKTRFARPEETPAPKTEQTGFFVPDSVPAPMLQRLRELLDRTNGIRNAYIKGMRKDGVSSYLVIVDFNGTNPAVFQQIAQQVGPLTGGVALNFVSYQSNVGRTAVGNTPPFYQRMSMMTN